MKTIFVLICLYVIPYVSMDMNAMLADLKKLLDNKEMTFSMKGNDVHKLFKEYAEKKRGEVKEHMIKQALQELIAAGTLKKGGFEYADYAGESIVLKNNALTKLKGIVKGNVDKDNIEKVTKYLKENEKLANINRQVTFIHYHYAKKNHPDELAAFLKDLVASADLETKAPAETPLELKTPATTEGSVTSTESKVTEELVPRVKDHSN